ncbi:type I-E CRISPR-associated protein Cas6/Cse3/CasE [Niveispirillum sp. SYP-B3756]|uniref:type I-E CRISPR-associated protein Cas6/Cse3/CasE n=1 Tax=Niveispirillum sp. SYP-B3756 TaxID=2662178 RepID=UPI001292776D|nr:type I-E CRISPR-associated protein Cas6/Cse3/CasE [Niveispirillum sp. SYP-B3756]MQP65504.1 type I-E CRISPR-associated protein Cas6/Cse3/CasE [Niveispirillum sp. SYP-B3756]
MTGQPLYMLQLPLDGRRVTAFALAHGLGGDISDGDGGYVAHALLSALFGSQAPKPFVLQPRPHHPGAVDLLAYSTVPLASLQAAAALTAQPLAHAAVDWTGAAEKTMPASLPEGLVLGFQVRVCPTMRLARGAQEKNPGAELDAFLAALDQWKAKGSPEIAEPVRETVYQQWVTNRLNGVELLELRLEGLRHVSLSRRAAAPVGASRPLRSFRKPDALYAGRFRVTNSQQLLESLAHGIGRHRAFGFGMLLLRP